MTELKDNSSISSVLAHYQNQVYDLSARNPFVNVNIKKLWFHTNEAPNNTQAKKILAKQQLFIKEYGLETTLNIGLFIKWKLPNKDQFFTSPLLYQSVRIKKQQKIEMIYSLTEPEVEGWEVNPILIHLFKTHFKIELHPFYEDIDAVIDDLKGALNTTNYQLEVLENFNEIDDWQIIKQKAVGTFNYQKSMLAHDFDTIIDAPNKTIKQLFGFEDAGFKSPVKGDLDWFPLDSSQKEVVAYAAENNMVIQGPPGTGKSHTIVTLLQHYLALNKKVLFVSEKKSALDVVYQRLGALKHLAAYFNVETHSKNAYYNSLKTAYEKAQLKQYESISFGDAMKLSASKIYPTKVNEVDEKSNMSIGQLENELIKNEAEKLPVHPQSAIPTYGLWELYRTQLSRIEAVAKADWGLNTIGESLFLTLNQAVFQDRTPLVKIDKKIDELLHGVKLIEHIQSDYQLHLEWGDFSKLCLSASILNMVNRSQIDLLFEDTKSYKSFNNWSKKYELTKNQLNGIKLKNTAWKKRPSMEAILTHSLLANGKGILAKHKYKRSHKALFKQYSQPAVPLEKGLDILNALQKEYDLQTQLDEIAIKLKHNLNVLNPDTEIDFIFNIRKKVENTSHNHYQAILEHPEQEELISLLADQHQVINNVNRIKQFLFSADLPNDLKEFKRFLEDLKAQLSRLNHSINDIKVILELPNKVLSFIRLNKYSIASLSKIVTKYELENALRYQNYLKHLNGSQLINDLTAFNSLKQSTHQLILEEINRKQTKAYQTIEDLCATPHSKLNEAEKQEKIGHKKAKRLVLHELNKTRQLLPIKELFAEAEKLMTTLQPIWMLNPLAIAKRLPLVADMFDVVIFDESSQIPLEDAIPAIYRAKQLVVVGDSMQMPPSRFFSANNSTTTILDEAETGLKSRRLLWHYRSEHPNLIAFSNQQFYDNELKLFPAMGNRQPIDFHYIANGVFADSVNQFEATAITFRLRELLDKGENDIAIIALSKEQERCIRKTILKNDIVIPDSVVIRNLDSVQGIEKNRVLISIGYAKNTEGKLYLNFGPINHEQGANRLNVLFSRAIQKMEVYSSIKSSELGLSDNKGLSILGQFLQFASNTNELPASAFKDALETRVAQYLQAESIDFHYESETRNIALSCFTNQSRQKVLLVNPGVGAETEVDLHTTIAILKSRFKAVKIILNADWLNDAEKVKMDVKIFMAEN